MIVELTVDEAARGSISADTPLVLHLPAVSVAGAREVLPVVFDGEDYRVIGYTSGGPNRVKLVTLPPVKPEPKTARQAKGTGHPVRILFYKKLGVDDGSRGAQRVRWPGEEGAA
jgi:hypothetical protein